MKVQCDFCSKEEASVFCCADQAALCEACDLRVHRANKLARKHRRLSLSAQSQPVCDICQEKRAFVFCQQDRAILCHDCDAAIHSAANELTRNHNRFLLTGVRLSSVPIPDAQDYEKSVVADDQTTCVVTINSSENSSSISEYLIKTLPGYRVEDLLVDDAVTAAKDAFFKVSDTMSFIEADLDLRAAVTEEFPIWVPDVPQIPKPKLFSRGEVGSVLLQNYGVKMGRERGSDDSSFMVPQINSKRPRTSSAWDF